MYKLPSGPTARNPGVFRRAMVAGPPSPENPGTPVPATVVITPSGPTRRTRAFPPSPIVHRGGEVDEEFLRRTSQNLPIGRPLPVDGAMVSRLANAAVHAGCHLLRVVDNW